MKRIYNLIFIIISFNCFSQTQAEMNQQAYDEFNIADKKLNEVYEKINSVYRTDTLFLKNLKRSQLIWIKFRDSELNMKFPVYPNRDYGSIQRICRADYLKELTEKRIEILQNWITGTEESDICKGSVKIIEKIDPQYMGKASVQKDGSIWLTGNMKRDHRIFGYEKKKVNSRKMILLSVFTNEVENNPFDCKYGAYYDTNRMEEISLKYISTEEGFIKVAVLKNHQKLDEVYMLKKWFEFEKK